MLDAVITGVPACLFFSKLSFLHMSAMIGYMEILKLTITCQTEMHANVFVGAVDLATVIHIWIFFSFAKFKH